MEVRVAGSIPSEVPVQRVCPNEPTGNSSPRLLDKGESMSQPKPRRLSDVGGCCGVVIFSTAGERNTVLPFSRAWANLDNSAAVENNHACPDTRHVPRDVVACTDPRRNR